MDTKETAEEPYIDDELSNLYQTKVSGGQDCCYWWLGFADEAETRIAANCNGSCAWTSTTNTDDEGMDGIDSFENDTLGMWIGCYDQYNYKPRIGAKLTIMMYLIIGNDAIELTGNVTVVEAEEEPYEAPDFYTLDNIVVVDTLDLVCSREQPLQAWTRMEEWEDQITGAVQRGFNSVGISNMATTDCEWYTMSPTQPDTLTNAYTVVQEGELNFKYKTDGQLPLEGESAALNMDWWKSYGGIWLLHDPSAFPTDQTTSINYVCFWGYRGYFVRVNMQVNVIPERERPTELTEVGHEEIYLPCQANAEDWSVGYDYDLQISWDSLCTLLQCAPGENPKLMGYDAEGQLNNSYTTSTTPGFWLSQEGYTVGYGDEEHPNVCFFENFQKCHIGNYGHIPGADDDGTSYAGKLIYANIYTGLYYTLNYRFQFMAEPKDVEVVGEENLLMPIDFENNITLQPIDLTKALAALGVEGSDIPMEAEWGVNVFGPLYSSENFDPEYGFGFDEQAQSVSMDQSPLFCVGFQPKTAQGPSIQAELLNLPDEEENLRYDVRIALGYQGKWYVYNVAYVSQDLYTGISTVTARPGSAKTGTYNLAGQRVDDSYRGIVISGGRKTLRK